MPNGVHDFDFLIGSWRVNNRMLRHRLASSSDWDEFEGTLDVGRVGILGIVDHFEAIFFGSKMEGMSIRLYDPVKAEWSIYWTDSTRPGIIQPPVRGIFREGNGLFLGDGTHNGQPVKVRYRWTEIRARSARWEQAYSWGEGRPWETNWVMDLTKVGE